MSKNFELLAAMKADSYVEDSTTYRPEEAKPDEDVPYEVAEPLSPAVLSDRADDPSSILYSEFNNLVQRLFLGSARPARSVVFCGVDEKSGSNSSWICAQTAEALAARIDRFVCVVRTPGFNDIDARPATVRSRISTSFDERERKVGRNLFTSWLKLNDNRSSSRNDTSAALRDLHTRFDYLIIDAPPISNGGEAEAFGRWADGVVLVVEALATRRQVALRTVEKLQASGIKILGTVVNNRTFPIPEGLYRRL
jgi:hypothetical protein